jgi:hypothetical protein
MKIVCVKVVFPDDIFGIYVGLYYYQVLLIAMEVKINVRERTPCGEDR